MGMAYDKTTSSIVMFSGSNGSADTWLWNGAWSSVQPATSPTARGGHALVPDGTGNLVLFGGVTPSGTFLNDTWTWDGNNWIQQFPPVSPSARAHMAMAYDPGTNSVLLFSGCSVSSGICTLDDTWSWNGTARTWSQLNPTMHPSARRAPMAYDYGNSTMLLFGGDNGAGTQYTDSWTWNGSNWMQIYPSKTPIARTAPNMVYDDKIGQIVLFGGYAGVWQDSLDDTWVWNGSAWKQIDPATTPANRYWFGMAYHPGRGAIVMFGGFSSTVVRSDTWLLSLVP
jgi:hypothetical protein